MKQFPSTTESEILVRPPARIIAKKEDPMMRGLAYGVVISLAIWLAAGYLTFILR